MSKELTKGYTCACGKFNRFVGYVYAHWDIDLIHTCDCGRKVVLLRGLVIENNWAEVGASHIVDAVMGDEDE